MSAGAYTIAKYQASYGAGGEIHPIRVQPETIAAAIGSVTNAEPAGAQTNPIQARVSGGRRQIGLQARFVVLRAPSGSEPDGYLPNGLTRIPALTETFYNAATKGVDVTYLGTTYTVVSRGRERVDGSDGG